MLVWCSRLAAPAVVVDVGAACIHSTRQMCSWPSSGLAGRTSPGVWLSYAALWFSTPFCLASLLTSLRAIVVSRRAPRRHLPAYSPRARAGGRRRSCWAVHHLDRPGRHPEPQWLVIPQQGLCTGSDGAGAVGTGKTACVHPYVDQLLRWRARADPDQKMGGGWSWRSKGRFLLQVRSMLQRRVGSGGLRRDRPDSGVCYNPLHSDPDPCAAAYAIATPAEQPVRQIRRSRSGSRRTDLHEVQILLRRSPTATTFAGSVPHPGRLESIATSAA